MTDEKDLNTKSPAFEEELIAPCGMNCGVCSAHLRNSKPCPGCKNRNVNKPKHCITCSIVNCEYLANTTSKLCTDCEKFPCLKLKQLDARYRKNYKTSLIGNLQQIQTGGMETFLNEETLKWTCPSCRKIMCIHSDICLNCKEPRTN